MAIICIVRIMVTIAIAAITAITTAEAAVTAIAITIAGARVSACAGTTTVIEVLLDVTHFRWR